MATRTAPGSTSPPPLAPSHPPQPPQRRRPARPPYPLAFRREAVALVQGGTGSIPQIARELGVHQETLRLWVRQAEVDAGQRDGVTSDAQAELVRLRREVARVSAERDLLKQALGFFAKASAPRCTCACSSRP